MKLTPWILSALVIVTAAVAGRVEAAPEPSRGTPTNLRARLETILGQPLPHGSPEEASAIAELETLATTFDALGLPDDAARARGTATLLKTRTNEKQA
jgi:hypothetical protein